MADRRTDTGHLGIRLDHRLEDVCRYADVNAYNDWWLTAQVAMITEDLRARRSADLGSQATVGTVEHAEWMAKLNEPDQQWIAEREEISKRVLSPTDFADLRAQCTDVGALGQAIADTKAQIDAELAAMTGVITAPPGPVPTFEAPSVAPPIDTLAQAGDPTMNETMMNGTMPASAGGGLKRYQSEWTMSPMWMKVLTGAGAVALGFLGYNAVMGGGLMGGGKKKKRKRRR